MKNIEHLHHTKDKIEYHKKMSKIVDEPIIDILKFMTIEQYASFFIQQEMEKEKFTIVNLNSVIEKYIDWRNELPMVKPHYAVKCNPDPKILRLLSCLGCHFDCASQGEIDLVSNQLGKYNVKPSSIVYSNPVKKKDMIQYAMDHNVHLTVFDSKEELLKLSKIPDSHKIELLLRLKIENEESICNLSNKFGCEMTKVTILLQLALLLNMNVVGVCFHVGSGCKNIDSYKHAFNDTYKVFKIANELGMKNMHIVDIGGGFNGENMSYNDFKMPSFKDIASILRKSIKKFENKISCWENNPPKKIKFISEPGRFFVSEAVNVVTNIFFKKYDKETDTQTLFIDDGIYGSFNNMMYDHSQPIPKKLILYRRPSEDSNVPFELFKGLTNDKDETKNINSEDNSRLSCRNQTLSNETSSTEFIRSNPPFSKMVLRSNSQKNEDNTSSSKKKELQTIIFGQYCDGLDQISNQHTKLPSCKVNDWLLWKNMGAYSHTTSYHFNGFSHVPHKKYIML